MVPCVLFGADCRVDAGEDQALRDLGTQQEVVEPQAAVSRPPIRVIEARHCS